MPTPSATPTLFLLCRLRDRLCALPVRDLVETLRPLPVAKLPGAPPFVSGVAVIRGAPTPVVDGGRLLGAEGPGHPTRFVLLRLGERRVALAVESVERVTELSAAALARVTPLLGALSAELVEAIGSVDDELLLSLRAASLVPEEVFHALAGATA